MSDNPEALPELPEPEPFMGLCYTAHQMRAYARAALAQQAATPAPAEPLKGSWVNADDVARLARELDVAMNGEAGAAQRPALCDVVAQAVRLLAAQPATPAAQPADEREAFEEWAVRTHGKHTLSDPDAGSMWSAWQARAALKGNA